MAKKRRQLKPKVVGVVQEDEKTPQKIVPEPPQPEFSIDPLNQDVSRQT